MGETVNLKSASGTVLSFDAEVGAGEIALRERDGWTRIGKAEATAALKAQDAAQQQAATMVVDEVAGAGEE